MSTHRLPVAGDYSLEDWDAGQSYRISHGDEGGDRGGVFGGTIDAAGWNRSYLVARRHAMIRSEGDGIMLLHLDDGRVEGPLADSVFARRASQDSSLAGVRLVPAREIARALH